MYILHVNVMYILHVYFVDRVMHYSNYLGMNYMYM